MADKDPDFFGLTLGQIAVVGPTFASACTFAYVVGYFYAFDIAWFPFFSLSEHIVFALRALPIAFAALICFAMALSFRMYSRLITLWILVIFLFIVVLFGSGFLWSLLLANHLGPAISLLFLVIWIIFFPIYEYNYRSSENIKYMDISYWAVSLAVACVFAGYFSGKAWQCDNVFPDIHTMYVSHAMPDDKFQKPVSGHVIFSGSKGVLLYDQSEHDLQLIAWEMIDKIRGCKKSNNNCVDTGTNSQSISLANQQTPQRSNDSRSKFVNFWPPRLNACLLIGKLIEQAPKTDNSFSSK